MFSSDFEVVGFLPPPIPLRRPLLIITCIKAERWDSSLCHSVKKSPQRRESWSHLWKLKIRVNFLFLFFLATSFPFVIKSWDASSTWFREFRILEAGRFQFISILDSSIFGNSNCLKTDAGIRVYGLIIKRARGEKYPRDRYSWRDGISPLKPKIWWMAAKWSEVEPCPFGVFSAGRVTQSISRSPLSLSLLHPSRH